MNNLIKGRPPQNAWEVFNLIFKICQVMHLILYVLDKLKLIWLLVMQLS